MNGQQCFSTADTSLQISHNFQTIDTKENTFVVLCRKNTVLALLQGVSKK
jgi:hypothetical protein